MSFERSDSIKSDENRSMSIDKNQIEENYKSEIKENTFYPWIKPNSKCHKLQGMLKLHYEILDFYDFIKLNKEEIELREKTFNYIKNIIEDNYPDFTCKLYGSYKTGLSLPNSDIDILIYPKDEYNEKYIEIMNNKKLLIDSLEKIYYFFLEQNTFSLLERVIAKVPIIKCIYKETNIHIDICLFEKNGDLAIPFIEKIIKVYPEIRPLMLILKYTLRQRKLNEIYTGGVSSFIIFSLLYYYLTDLKKRRYYNKNNGKEEEILTLGDILLGFLNFYGFEFNYSKLGISINNGCFLYKRKEKEKFILSIKNFQEPNQELGKSCYKFKYVIDTFKLARDCIYYPDIPVVSYLKGFILEDDILRKRAQKNKNI